MIKPTLLVAGLFATICFSGCVARPKPMYYYGTYAKTLYKTKKDPTSASSEKHQASLEDVLRVSMEKGLRVPPGIHCEYGYLLWKKGQKPEAEAQFRLEMEIYPESVPFVTLVIDNLKHDPST